MYINTLYLQGILYFGLIFFMYHHARDLKFTKLYHMLA